jgi:hypothetical protein
MKACKRCGGEVLFKRQNAVYCGPSCRRLVKPAVATYPGVSAVTAGAISELRVACDLMKRGYPVFRALSPACLCDLVAWTAAGAVRIEVRSSGGVGALIRKQPKDVGRQDVFAFVDSKSIAYEPELPPP